MVMLLLISSSIQSLFYILDELLHMLIALSCNSFYIVLLLFNLNTVKMYNNLFKLKLLIFCLCI
jgi:hypothetical protein